MLGSNVAALTWYALEGRVRWVFWAISSGLALLLGLLIIPLLNRVLFGYVYEAWSLGELTGLALALLVGMAGTIAFLLADRRLGKRCPRCGQQVEANFQPETYCQANGCGQPLHAWLTAPY